MSTTLAHAAEVSASPESAGEPWTATMHVVTVGGLTVGADFAPLVPLTVRHPEGCAYRADEENDYDCPVLFEFANLDPWQALLGVWWNWNTTFEAYPSPGEYTVDYWFERYDIPGEPVEYNAGLTFDPITTTPNRDDAPAVEALHV